MLCLGYMVDLTEEEVLAHIVGEFEIEESEVAGFEVLVAYEDAESYEAGNWFLLRGPDGELYENHGGHCSCFGFEGQWSPEVTSVTYLQSDNFHVSTYRDSDDSEIRAFVRALE